MHLVTASQGPDCRISAKNLDICLSLPMGRTLHAARNHRSSVIKSRRRIGSQPRDHARFGLRFTGSNHEIETSEMGFNGQLVHCTNFSLRMSAWGQNPNASRMLACQLWPAADKPPHALYSAMCQHR